MKRCACWLAVVCVAAGCAPRPNGNLVQPANARPQEFQAAGQASGQDQGFEPEQSALKIAPLRAPPEQKPPSEPPFPETPSPPESTPPVAATPAERSQPPVVAVGNVSPPRREKPIVAPPRRSNLPLYSACPSITLSYCVGQLRPAPETVIDVLSPEQVTTLRRCELDLYRKAFIFFSQDIATPETDLTILRDHCAADFLKKRAIEAARKRMAP
jgi:hypothetical protein